MKKPSKQVQEMGPYISLLFRIGVGMFLSIFSGFGLGLVLYRYWIQQIWILFLGMAVGLVLGFVFLFKEIQKGVLNE